MDKVFVRAPFAYDADETSDFSAVEFLPDSSLTHQAKNQRQKNQMSHQCLFFYLSILNSVKSLVLLLLLAVVLSGAVVFC